MGKGKIALHETFELQELLTFKNICATKASAMSKLVTDEELSSLLKQDFTSSCQQIQELKDLIQLSTLWDKKSIPDYH